MKRRVVITGIGTVNPIGNNVEETWEGIKGGRCGIAPITAYDASERKVKLAGEVKDPDFDSVLDKKELRKMDRYTRFAMMAAAEAMRNAGYTDGEEVFGAERFGVIFSSGIGGIATIESEHMRGIEKGFDRVSPFYIPMAISNMAAGWIAIKYGLKGICTSEVTACASAANAIGDAFRNIRDGYEDAMVCGGAEAAITELSMGGFTSMKALSKAEDPARASIPFDAERSGFVMGEGAGALVLEEYSRAVERGARIYGEIVGFGANCDAHHITAPLEDGSGAAECMKRAVIDAGIEMKDIEYINAHGTSTTMNDRSETAAVKL
ncbi:MAG: beta-ketoacyl-ACP synthase II, partial [Eubacterium sp.]|nr:beta-ketoacyl-ACP synthase II [Eubacterium sp.]